MKSAEVVDGHPVHKARSVTRWLDEHREQIRVFFLPSYSPELNPDELLNQDVKTNALGRVRPVNVQEMMDNVRSYLRITQARPTVVYNYFCERHVRYGQLSVTNLVLGVIRGNFPLLRNEEMSGAAFCDLEKMVGRVALVCDDRISGESALCCS